jgi:hypothetical protein
VLLRKGRAAIAAAAAGLLCSLVAAGAAEGAPAAAPAQLLARHAPVLVLHPAERLMPVPVDGFLADSDLLVRAADGTWRPSAIPLAEAGRAFRLDQRLCRAIEGPAALGCYATSERAHEAGPTVYGAVRREGNRIALQYWLFYPANLLRGTSDAGAFWQMHEGDWEAVTVLLDRRGRPQTVALSQHCAGARREWAKAPRRGTRPIVHVALGSHANYFTPGRKALSRRCLPPEALALVRSYEIALLDLVGSGRAVTPEVAVVTATAPSWMAFGGTWGEDQYVHVPGFTTLRYGTAPVGPALHALWRRPLATPLAWPRGS